MSEKDIKRITSFTVNHNVLKPGFYISRIDGDITTYDMRTRIPNAGDYMDNATMHSVEHMIATYIRNSDISDDVIYFGPMGCQTGFYLVVRNQKPTVVLEYLKDVIKKTLAHEGGVFGASAIECGNYRNLSLDAAKKELSVYYEVIKDLEEKDFVYKEQ